MANTYKKLAQVQAPNSVGAIYTVPASTQTIIKHIRVVNTSGGAVTIKLWHDGTTDSNTILPAVSIAAGEWAEFDGTILMEASDTLQAEASAATSITLTIYGLEIS